MKKSILLSVVIFMSINCFAQADNNTCVSLTKKDIIGELEIHSAKQKIPLSNGRKNNISFNAMKSSQALILMFPRQKEQEMLCVSTTSKIYIQFDDSTEFDMTHMREVDCTGMFVIMLGEVLENGDKLDMISNKKIKKITIEYQDIDGNDVITIPEETILTTAEADKIFKTIQCLTK